MPRLLMPDPFTRFEDHPTGTTGKPADPFSSGGSGKKAEGLDFILNGEMIEHRETRPLAKCGGHWQKRRYDLSVVAKTSVRGND
ncbi:hypothetical protein MASR2M15_29790 [Anaerolineales bacterium]